MHCLVSSLSQDTFSKHSKLLLSIDKLRNSPWTCCLLAILDCWQSVFLSILKFQRAQTRRFSLKERDEAWFFSPLAFFPTRSYRSCPAFFPTLSSPYRPFAFPMTKHSSKWPLEEKPAASKLGPAGWLKLITRFLSQISNLSSDVFLRRRRGFEKAIRFFYL